MEIVPWLMATRMNSIAYNPMSHDGLDQKHDCTSTHSRTATYNHCFNHHENTTTLHRLQLLEHRAQRRRCTRAHVGIAAWHLIRFPLDAHRQVSGSISPTGFRCASRRFAKKTAAHLAYHHVHSRSVIGAHALELRLRERLPVNVFRPWIGDVLDNPLSVEHQHLGRLQAGCINRCRLAGD